MSATMTHGTLLSHTTFILLPNRSNSGARKIEMLYSVIVVPFLLFGFGVYAILEMRGTPLLIAMAFSLVLLVNMYFFIVRDRRLHEMFALLIHQDEITLCRDRTELHTASLADIRIEQLSWGEEKLPAIQLSGTQFPRLLIGHGGYQMDLHTHSRIHQMTDFWISSEREWQELLRLLL